MQKVNGSLLFDWLLSAKRVNDLMNLQNALLYPSFPPYPCLFLPSLPSPFPIHSSYWLLHPTLRSLLHLPPIPLFLHPPERTLTSRPFSRLLAILLMQELINSFLFFLVLPLLLSFSLLSLFCFFFLLPPCLRSHLPRSRLSFPLPPLLFLKLLPPPRPSHFPSPLRL